MEDHEAAVKAIVLRTRRFYETKTRFRVYHGSTNSTRRSQRRQDKTIDTSCLNHVLEVDREKKTVIVEPNVPMDALVKATLEHGLVPLVVMEFPGITVGGGFSGTSGESSSFRYGAFETIVNWIEIVLPAGDITRASKTEKPDLFWGAASAFGTLGVVTLLEVQLRDAKPYVELTYRLVRDFAEVVEVLQAETSQGTTNDYVDAVTFSLNSTLICTGRLVDALPNSTTAPRRFLRARDPWFYVHAQGTERQLQQQGSATVTDHVPLVDYLFRWDRGGFWTGRYAFRYFLTPFNRITRFLLDSLLRARVMYRALHHSGLADFYVVQDVGVPYAAAADFAGWLDRNLQGVYPLWLCPLRIRRDGGGEGQHGLHAAFADPEATPEGMLNFGVWGPLGGKSFMFSLLDRRECVRLNRALESKVHELGGKKWLYGHAYYTEDEFWGHYDRASYDALRERYGADYLPSVYDKVRVDVDAEAAAVKSLSWLARVRAGVWTVWPLRGLYGVCKTVVGSDYLLQRGKVKKKQNR